MTHLRDVIEIPPGISASDFVVGLSQGVEDRAGTLRTYVVTPQLAECFDKALGLVAGATEKGRSTAAFLHGSFGSGKSHFMAVLYMLLERDPDARAVPELGSVVARHDDALSEKSVLPLTFHMIGADSLEQAVLGGYLRQVRERHPDAPLPAVHRSDALMDNAEQMCERMGDEAFLEVLNEGTGSGASSGWGTMATAGGATAWDLDSYQSAIAAPAGDPRRDRLVSDLTRTHFPAFASSSTGYLDLDTGLGVISRHAATLGYDAVVLFLDELILWLAAHLGDRAFVSNEGAKLAKLVEAQDADRAVPLISLIARQRDITEFLGNHVPGAERVAFGDVFSWSRGRFDDIRLEDRNLPIIAQKRLLRPKDDGARQTLDEAFGQVDRRPEVWDVLLTGAQVESDGTGSDQETFRRTYPFSPALVSTLVALSQALQRERTALKVMLQLLVEGRDELEVSDLVPVGDLFDVLVDSEAQAVTDELKHQFETARRIYTTKMRPVLLDMHQLTPAQAEGLPRDHVFVTDARLAKTLLLAALAPDVPALSGLTASRLAALNHGTIASWVPGQEVAVVLQKMKDLAAQVSEVSVTEDDDPRISVELTDVDYESVLERARGVDNEGNRRRLLRQAIWDQMGVREKDTLGGVQQHALVWRGRQVTVDLVFGNVRDTAELPDPALVAEDDRWKVVIDYPFDAEGQSPRSDLSRVEQLRSRGVDSQTLLWIPAFLTPQRIEDLGTLVVLDHLLGGAGERFVSSAQHLGSVEREQARNLLKQRRTLLRERIEGCLRQAYGVATRADSDIDRDSALESPLATLAEGFSPQHPVGATLRDAFRHAVGQALAHTWPKHPRFEPDEVEVRASEVRKVLEACEQALAQPGGRLTVEQRERATLRKICNTLEVGRFHENHLQLDGSTFPWGKRLVQAAARDGHDDTVPVGRLLAYLDDPEPRGLSRATSGLIIRVHALMQDLAWCRDGVAVDPPAVDQVSAAYELRKPDLPDAETWAAAVANAPGVGVQVTELLSAANVARLVGGVRDAEARGRESARALQRELGAHAADVPGAEEPPQRLRTASAVGALLDAVGETSSDQEVVAAVARVEWPSSAAAGKRSLESAPRVVASIGEAHWDVLRRLRDVTDERRDRAQSLLGRLSEAWLRDELSDSLVAALPEVERQAVDLLTVTPPPSPQPTPSADRQERTVPASEVSGVLDEIRAAADQAGEDRLTITWVVEE